MEIPTVTPRELAEKLKLETVFILLDVREPWELRYAKIDDRRMVNTPMTQLSRLGLVVLPETITANPEAEIVVMCHHGIRSTDVTRWLLAQGWKNVRSLDGGIAKYATEIDKSVGQY
jgi:rhodanese-related sulfurtransferase